jgi:hypothetical protein
MTRREFLVGSATAGLSGSVFADVAAVSSKPTCQGGDVQLLGSAPVLMNPAERSMDVVFAVNGDASGWVDVSMSSDMSNSVRVHSGFGPVMRDALPTESSWSESTTARPTRLFWRRRETI